MKRPLVLPFALLLLLAPAIPAAAAQPVTWYDRDFESDFDVVDCASFDHDFVVWDYVAGRESETGFFDPPEL